MKALRLYGHEDIRLEDVEEPAVPEGWALLEVLCSSMCKLADSVKDEDGGLIEPLAVVTHAVRRTGLLPGDSVTVVGGGMIGIGALKVARAAGASDVYVVEPLAERRARALEMGATAAI